MEGAVNQLISVSLIRTALALSFMAAILPPYSQCRAISAPDTRILEKRIASTDWAKIRGANFIPSYASNSYEIWRNYNHETFDRELQLVSEVGYGSVRLWLNYEAFEELNTTFVERVQDALALCAKYHLRAVIVLFDSCGLRHQKDAEWMTAGSAYRVFQSSSRFTPEQK